MLFRGCDMTKLELLRVLLDGVVVEGVSGCLYPYPYETPDCPWAILFEHDLRSNSSGLVGIFRVYVMVGDDVGRYVFVSGLGVDMPFDLSDPEFFEKVGAEVSLRFARAFKRGI